METHFCKENLVNFLNYWYYDEEYNISLHNVKEIISKEFKEDNYNWEDIEVINEKVYKTLLPYTFPISNSSGADAD